MDENVKLRRLLSLTGKPNAGKGTLVRGLEEHYRGKGTAVDTISGSGVLNTVDPTTAIGRDIQKTIKSGGLVDSSVVNGLMHDAIDKSSGGIILLDGAIRTMDQAVTYGKESAHPIDAMIHVDASDELCVNRASKRLICEDCGTPFALGDIVSVPNLGWKMITPETPCPKCDGKLSSRADDLKIAERLSKFNSDTLPIIDYFKRQGSPVLDIKADNKGIVKDKHTLLQEATDFVSNEFGL